MAADEHQAISPALPSLLTADVQGSAVVTFHTWQERYHRRKQIASTRQPTMCEACLYGHRTECESDDCCCMCNESIHAQKGRRVRQDTLVMAKRKDEELWIQAIEKSIGGERWQHDSSLSTGPSPAPLRTPGASPTPSSPALSIASAALDSLVCVS
jgi:hypothetical protein